MTYKVTFNKQNFISTINMLGFEKMDKASIYEKVPVHVYSKHNIYIFIGVQDFILDVQKRNTKKGAKEISFKSYEKAFNFIHTLLGH